MNELYSQYRQAFRDQVLTMQSALRVSVVLWLSSLVASKPGVLKQIEYLESSNSPLLQYPTQFTQGIVPKYIHSHNDCKSIGSSLVPGTNTVVDWREVPLLTALSNGVSSVEADVWLVNETLYVRY